MRRRRRGGGDDLGGRVPHCGELEPVGRDPRARRRGGQPPCLEREARGTQWLRYLPHRYEPFLEHPRGERAVREPVPVHPAVVEVLLSLQGLGQTLEAFAKVKSRLNPELAILALAFVIHDGRSAWRGRSSRRRRTSTPSSCAPPRSGRTSRSRKRRCSGNRSSPMRRRIEGARSTEPSPTSSWRASRASAMAKALLAEFRIGGDVIDRVARPLPPRSELLFFPKLRGKRSSRGVAPGRGSYREAADTEGERSERRRGRGARAALRARRPLPRLHARRD